MKFDPPLKKGVFLKRYKRFFADINVNGKIITAHCPNTGRMTGCNTPLSPCLFSKSDNPKRKLPYTLEMIKSPSSWVGVNTTLPNKIVYEAWENKQISAWEKFDCAQTEVKINDSTRLDLVLWQSQQNHTQKIKTREINFFSKDSPSFHFIEIKNVSLVEGKRAFFPDATTTRGQKHLKELSSLIQYGHTCEIFFLIQRTDAENFSPADHVDPEYGALLRKAKDIGVNISSYMCNLSSYEINIQNPPLEIILD